MYNIIFKRDNEELALISKENTSYDYSYRFLKDAQRRFEKFSLSFQIVIHFHLSYPLQKALGNGFSRQIYQLLIKMDHYLKVSYHTNTNFNCSKKCLNPWPCPFK